MKAHIVVLNSEAVGHPDWTVIASAIEKGHADCDVSACCLRLVANEIRAQIPQPKPDEPQGLGAVVEDADGDKWVWLAQGAEGAHWHRVGIPDKRANWHQIAAVRVLSEGVTP